MIPKKFFVTNTFTTEKEMKPYLELAEKYDYRVVSMIIENRHGNDSLHGVPEFVMEKMLNRFSFKLR
jgi:predicted kinase